MLSPVILYQNESTWLRKYQSPIISVNCLKISHIEVFLHATDAVNVQDTTFLTEVPNDHLQVQNVPYLTEVPVDLMYNTSGLMITFLIQ